MASVRYIVANVDEAVAFYRDNLDFKIDKHNPGKFAALMRDDLTLYLSAPGAGSGGQAGGDPKPGGWNRFMIVTDEIDALIERLRRADAQIPRRNQRRRCRPRHLARRSIGQRHRAVRVQEGLRVT